MGKIIEGIFRKADAFLLGRTTYDIFASYWPHITDPANLIAGKLNGLPKFVASRTRNAFEWNNTTLVRDAVKDVVELKKRFSREVQVHGSCGLDQTLVKNDLVDEYRLLTFPVTLGIGKRLFGSGTVPRTLKLVKSNLTGKGIVVSVYRPAGCLKTGSFVLDESKG